MRTKFHMPQEAKDRISQANLGKPKTQETKDKVSESLKETYRTTRWKRESGGLNYTRKRGKEIKRILSELGEKLRG